MIDNNQVVSILVPVYNEEETVGKVLRELLKIKLRNPQTEIIVVDDGSTDKTPEEVKKFPSIRYFRHEKNMGKGAAIKTGVKVALGKVVVIQDADLEYPPCYIPYLVKPICSKQSDVVYGSRFMGKCDEMSFSHRIGNFILSKITSLLYDVKITDVMTGHKAFSIEVFKSLNLKEKRFAVEIELTSKILRNGWKIIEVPISYSYRKYGNAKIHYLDGFVCLLKLLFYRLKGNDALS